MFILYIAHEKTKAEKKATDRTDGNKRVVFTTRNIHDSEDPSINTTLIVSDQEKTEEKSPLGQLEDKLQNLTNELSKEKDPVKQQTILKSINLLIDTISKLKS